MTKPNISAAEAVHELTNKTHLNRLQIRKIVGEEDFVSTALIAAIVTISDRADQEVTGGMAIKARPIRRFVYKTKKASTTRLTFPAARNIIEQFAEEEAL